MVRQRAPAKRIVYKSLRTYLPEMGMEYPKTRYLLSQPHRDDRVVAALSKARLLPRGKAYFYSTRVLNEALAHMFSVALRRDIKKHLTRADGGVLEYISALRLATPWAQDLAESQFIELVERLVAARMVYREECEEPSSSAALSAAFDLHRGRQQQRRHCRTAAAIDRLYAEVGGLWSVAEFELYEFVGGHEEEDNATATAAAPAATATGTGTGTAGAGNGTAAANDNDIENTPDTADVKMTDAHVAAQLDDDDDDDDDVARENVRAGVGRMRIRPRVDPRAYWFRSGEGGQ
ncbi:uncharacterized protein F4812DRAFT_468120 [Daldinia caldariorum]|uniref:uncharacterized protein n=1 Tax=Daldinia caldariorum TaxID=326644 RepID=UPI00200801BB|nr:uncharacterized protein F4812DRAFT_468120 [Daldinia caldariorum]KAI1464178.1 hypothetical protein F4812DRAFT_468120 [Daldinia caldariorum]